MDIMLFGTGDCYSKYKKWFDKVHIVALLDNDRSKQGMNIDGHKVLSPAEGVRKQYDYIFILSVHEAEIREQLRELGVDDTKIIHYYWLHNFLFQKSGVGKMPVSFYPNRSECESIPEGGQAVVMLSYDLNPSGAFFAFFEAAVVLKANGCYVTFASMDDGPMKEKVLDVGLPVVIDPNMQICTCLDIEWMKDYPIVFCNTLNFYHMLSKREKSKAHVWWLHEPEIFYSGIDTKEIERLSCENLYIYAAGKAAIKAFEKIKSDIKVSLLLYGMPDIFRARNRHEEKKGCRKKFAIVGNLQSYKGQDILIEAVRCLDEKDSCQADFFLYGNTASEYAETLIRKTSDLACVHFEGALSHDELLEKIWEMDALICPSREDTMPVAVTEAMMLNMPCIVSDAVGTAEYICDGKDGMIFKSGDAAALAAAIDKCINNQVDLPAMGNAARCLYNKYFSMEAFEQAMLEIFNFK